MLPLAQDDIKVQQEFSTNSLAPPSVHLILLRHTQGRDAGQEEETKTPVYVDFDC